MTSRICIRRCEPADAAAMLTLSARLDEETQFMLFEPGERTTTLEKQETLLDGFSSSDDAAMMVATDGGEIVGFAMATRKPFVRIRHYFQVVIGVQKSHWGVGCGRQLMEAIENWARGVGCTVLGLTVVAHNARAIALYKRCGFQIEGTRRNSLWIDGEYVDELYMSKLLAGSAS